MRTGSGDTPSHEHSHTERNICECVCVRERGGERRERQHSGVLKQLRGLIRLQAEISLDDKNSGTGLEEGVSRAAGGGFWGPGVAGSQMVASASAQVRCPPIWWGQGA